MVTHSYSHPPSCYDDPIFTRTHFLERVALEDLGIGRPLHRSKLRSAKHSSDLQSWNARWFHNVQSDDDGEDSTSNDDDSDDEAHPPVHGPARLAPRARSSTAPGPSSVSAFKPHSPPASKARQVPLSTSTKRVAVRHDRSASAPEPRLLPAQPLSIDTIQPLRLATTDVATLSPLSYPVGVFDANWSGPATTDAAPFKRWLETSSHSSSSIPASYSASATAFPRTTSAPSAMPVAAIECSESDGSCHNDAGDHNPEGQLAAEIIRLREARKLTARQAMSAEAELRTSTRDFAPETDPFDDDADLALLSHARHPILRFAEAMLDFGTASLEHFTGHTAESSSARDDASAAQRSANMLASPVRRVSTTPKDLCREAQLMRLRRQKTTSTRSNRSNSVNSLSTWLNGAESSLGLRARATRQAASLLSLPSLLSSSLLSSSSDDLHPESSSSSSSRSVSPPGVIALDDAAEIDGEADGRDEEDIFTPLRIPDYPSQL